jgi:Fe2+ transport system protein FeoA
MAMSIMPPGSWALIKLNNQDDGERFVILQVDPKKAERPGYMWSSTEPLTEEEAKRKLLEMGVDESRHFGLFHAAGKLWDVSHND